MVYTTAGIVLLTLALPGFLDFAARSLLHDRKYELVFFCITPAVAIGEVMNLIPGNPYAAGLPYALNLQALALVLMEKSAEGEQRIKRLLAFYESQADKSPISEARAMLLLCNALSQQGKLEESEEMSTKAIAILENHGDKDPRTLAGSLCDLCATLAKEGKANQAITIGNKALSLVQGERGSDDDQLRLLGMVLNNVAIAYDYAGDFTRAGELYKRSLDLKLKLFGDNTREAVIGYNNYGYSLLLQRQYEKSCEALEHAKNLAVKLDLQTSRLWLDILANCGDVHRGLKRFDEAEKEQLEALRLREQRYKLALDESYDFLGKLYRDKQDFAKSQSYFEKSLKIREKRFGDHPKVATTLEDYAELKRAMKLDSEADVLEERAKAIRKNFVIL
jgi:tetratricopeptide (TPR) repeat protein